MKQNKLDAQWLADCRAAMQNLQPSVPADGWSKLASSLPASTVPLRPTPQPRLWWRSVAAILLFFLMLGGGGIAFYYMGAPAESELAALPQETSSETGLPVGPKKSPVVDPKKYTVVEPESKSEIKPKSDHRQMASSEVKYQPIASGGILDTVSMGNNETSPIASVSLQKEERQTDTQSIARSDSSSLYQLRSAEEEAVLLAMADPAVSASKRHSSSRPTFALGMGVGVGDINPEDGALYSYAEPTSFSEVPEVVPLDVLDNKEIAPRRPSDKVTDSHNHQSWHIGVTASYPLSNRLAAVSGLVYTRLTSEVTVNLVEMGQSLHFVGVPLRLKYDFWQGKRWLIYGTGGPMVEWCFYASRGRKRLDTHPLHWSFGGALGTQYMFSRHFGLYLEPGFNYYLNVDSEVPTLRSEQPFQFSLQGGIRIKY